MSLFLIFFVFLYTGDVNDFSYAGEHLVVWAIGKINDARLVSKHDVRITGKLLNSNCILL